MAGVWAALSGRASKLYWQQFFPILKLNCRNPAQLARPVNLI